MRLLIMGAPGAGKGTQAALIKEEYKIAHISTGDMFRKAIMDKTPMGVIAATYIEKGNLVPDDVTIALVKERLQEKDCNNGFLLDGFPRTYEQAVALDKILNDLHIKLDAVINISVDDAYLVERITGRRVCEKCGASYHIKAAKPKVDGICDMCGGKLIQRKDDEEETIKNRLQVYYQKTKPVLDYYVEQGIVRNVSGVGDIEDIFLNIKKSLGEI